MPLPYHNGDTLICSDCHVVHASQQHSYTGGSDVSPPSGPPENYPWSPTPIGKLLRRASSIQLCLACHDGQVGVPDVLKNDTNGLGDKRAAGFFPADPDTTTYDGHNLGTVPGSLCTRCHFDIPNQFPVAQFTCIDCHNPHGNGNYRNLQWASSPASTTPIIAFTDAAGISKYDQDHVGYSAPSVGDATDNEVFCLSCHKAHGSGNVFGLRWEYGNSASATHKAGCQQCHNK